MKHIKLFEQFVTESYMNNFKEYEKEFKKRGLIRHSEEWSEGGFDDMWYTDFELGRFVVKFWGLNMAMTSDMSGGQVNKPAYEYSIYFEPFPKYKTKLFGLIKTKERQLGKQINFVRDWVDFSEGPLKIDDKPFMKNLFKMVDDGLKKSAEIATIEYLSYEDSKSWGRPAIDLIKTK
jgi:hypothetical protein